MTRKTQKHLLTIVNPHCAGIDIGAREHWVAINLKFLFLIIELLCRPKELG
jgi:hypothetical protein